MFLFVLLPFLKRKLTDFWSSQCLENQIDAQKDTYYRFIINPATINAKIMRNML